jgi:amino acid transporter
MPSDIQVGIRQELGLRNLFFCQFLNIVGLFWVGVAAKLGPAHVMFWIAAALLFYVPSAAVVIYLNRAHPVEGGLYEWARLGFNEFTGFLVGWNMWLNCVAILSYAGIQSATMLAYALGPRAAWIGESRVGLAAVTVLVLGTLIAIALAGMRLGKWVQDFGGAVLLVIFAALILLPPRNQWIGRPNPYPPFSLSLPAFSLFSLNVLSRMSFGAFSGFDSMAVFAGESRNARRNIGLSVILAAPVIALMYMLGTGSIASLVPTAQIDLVSPISQALTLGTRPGDPGAGLIPLVLIAMLLSFIASMALSFAVTTRLPMVAGWDRLLPEWFGRLHPRRQTPTNSILFVGGVAMAMAIAGAAGTGKQEAFQLLQTAAGVFYALAYAAMFLLPLIGKQRSLCPAPRWLQLASISGFCTTTAYLFLSLFPIIDVPNPGFYAAKLGGFSLACQLFAVALYYSYQRRRHSRDLSAPVPARAAG